MKKIILNYFPIFLQNLFISFYNSWLYRVRRSGVYSYYRQYFEYYDRASREVVEAESLRRLDEFLHHAVEKSVFYHKYRGAKLDEFGFLEKKDLIDYLDSIATIKQGEGVVSLTGGTTGTSMKVIYTKEDTQERNALLDHFRATYGYELGKKVGWFSGKDIVSKRDISKGICFRDDWFNKIRFYSTFHITVKNFDVYWNALINFSPEFLVGFPSSVYEICLIAKERGLRFPGHIRAFFPTAETVLDNHRKVIADVLGCRVIDQYASSEGAPFILECTKGNLHIHPLSGVFEVFDESGAESVEGEIVVTSFTTRGTPLIRYRIGDRLKLSSSKTCACGSCFPMVEKIDGRNTDFIWSPENGRVNLGNISNCTKDTNGIIQFQIVQQRQREITIFLVKNDHYRVKDERVFLSNLKSRLGNSVSIRIEYRTEIPKEKSGKFRIVKNS